MKSSGSKHTRRGSDTRPGSIDDESKGVHRVRQEVARTEPSRRREGSPSMTRPLPLLFR